MSRISPFSLGHAEVFASGLHASWSGTLVKGWVWHLGITAERTLCGRSFRGAAQPINRDDVYDPDWLCHACWRSDKALTRRNQ